uniref:Integrator complex subunit 12 n=1 Tax=Timema genevievae TaxID=629358 RepID=A0A7R9K8W8_TIMGE|nr:unnamed protein product [Timema genevievae]
MASIELDPVFVRAIRLLNSNTAKDAEEQLKSMLEEAIKQKYGNTKSLGNLVIEKESLVKRDSCISSSRKDDTRKELEKVDLGGNSQPGSRRGSGDTSRQQSPEIVDLDDDDFALGILEDDLTCVVCRGMDVTARNQLVECIECHSLYHQECHQPPVADVNDVRSVWYCSSCTKVISKVPARSSPKLHDRELPHKMEAVSNPFKRSESSKSNSGGRSTPVGSSNSSKSSSSSSGMSSSKNGGSSSSKNIVPKVNIVSADKRLQDMKKKAAAKQLEKRKHVK